MQYSTPISAFCNAVLTYMGVREPSYPLTLMGYPVINFAIMMLIVIGRSGLSQGGYMG